MLSPELTRPIHKCSVLSWRRCDYCRAKELFEARASVGQKRRRRTAESEQANHQQWLANVWELTAVDRMWMRRANDNVHRWHTQTSEFWDGPSSDSGL